MKSSSIARSQRWLGAVTRQTRSPSPGAAPPAGSVAEPVAESVDAGAGATASHATPSRSRMRRVASAATVTPSTRAIRDARSVTASRAGRRDSITTSSTGPASPPAISISSAVAASSASR